MKPVPGRAPIRDRPVAGAPVQRATEPTPAALDLEQHAAAAPLPRGLAPRKQRKPEIHRPQRRNVTPKSLHRLKQQTTHLFGSVGHAHSSYLRMSTRIRGRGIDKPLNYTTISSCHVFSQREWVAGKRWGLCVYVEYVKQRHDALEVSKSAGVQSADRDV